MGIGNLHSLLGLFAIASVAWLFSTDRRRLNWRVVGWGIGLQLGFGVLIFFSGFGRHIFLWLNDFVVKIINYADAGTEFVFGVLAKGMFYPGQKVPSFILGIQALPKVIFFAALVGLLYYFGVMQVVVRGFSWLFARLMGLSGAESLSVSSNIFVGLESAFLVKPFYRSMTRSELCTVLAGCMATIASTVLGLYVSFLYRDFPSIAGHLISASLLSAPAVLVASKLAMPETDTPATLGKVVEGDYERAHNWIDAIVRNAMEGVKLAVGIAAMLIAFKGLVAMADGLIGWTGGLVSIKGLSLSKLLTYAFVPFSWLMGVPGPDVWKVAGLLGTRIVETEVPSYIGLSIMMKQCAIDPRSAVIAAYALCGFAHLPSIAIFVGGISALVPSRTQDLSALAFRALFIATIACMMTGAVAGVFYTGPHILMLKKGKVMQCKKPAAQSPKKRGKKAAKRAKAAKAARDPKAAAKQKAKKTVAKPTAKAPAKVKAAPRKAAPRQTPARKAPTSKAAPGRVPARKTPPARPGAR